MAATQLQLDEDLTMVESGFLGQTGYQDHENLINDFSTMGDGVLPTVNEEDIICIAPYE